jgi:putative toxin-antitoxin system antitoxin component (TIGR02293 family)
MYEKAYAILGGKPQLMRDTSKALEVIREGLQLSTIEKATDALQINQKSFITLIGGTVRSFQRRKSEDRMNAQQSEHTLAILNLVTEAEEYFGDRTKALSWMKAKKLALGNQSPLDYCDTMTGIEFVADEINKLKFGMTA